MNIYDKPNSHRYKEAQKAKAEEKKIEKVVKGNVTTKKRSELSKFKDVFISDDAQNVKSYIFMDVLLPALKKAISDVVTNGVDMILYGSTGVSKKRSSGSKISYRNYYDDPRDDRRSNSASVRTRFDYDDIVFESRGDAEAVLGDMQDVIDSYGVVTVADMYDMAQLTQPYTSNKYGWMNIRNAEVKRVGDGYIIKLPKAIPIDN